MSGVSFLLRVLAGFGLGVVFYLGLWFTVGRLARARHPGLLALSSFWLRSLVVLAGFLAMVNGRWEYAVAGLTGFAASRFVAAKLVPHERTAPRCT